MSIYLTNNLGVFLSSYDIHGHGAPQCTKRYVSEHPND